MQLEEPINGKVFVAYVSTLSVAQIIKRCMTGRLMKDELTGMQKKAIMASFKIIRRNVRGMTKENY